MNVYAPLAAASERADTNAAEAVAMMGRHGDRWTKNAWQNRTKAAYVWRSHSAAGPFPAPLPNWSSNPRKEGVLTCG
jgi:hypothetical protein